MNKYEDVICFVERGTQHINDLNIANNVPNITNGSDLLENIEIFNPGYRVYKTRAHKEIFEVLYAQALNLVNGRYAFTQGICSSAMVAAKGVGKTACMKTFASIASKLFPQLNVLYISYNNFFETDRTIANESLLKTIKTQFIQVGLFKNADFESKESTKVQILLALQRRDSYLLIFVDELDQLYRINGQNEPVAVTNLHDLSFLANQSSGRVAITVCGSSAVMENLITTNANDDIRKEFLLLTTGAINLNRSKFITKRVYSTIPTDLESVASIVNVPLDDTTIP